jgi:hypothetical protein
MTLIPGLFLVLAGVPLLLGSAGAGATLKAFPRSHSAAWVLFGGASVWFLFNVWHLSPADFGDYRAALFIGFAAIAILAFKCVPDFLAVRGACVLALLCAMPLLDAAYMEYDIHRRLFMVSLVYVVIALAIWLGAQPWRARDFIEWVFARPGRSRAVGAALALYGLLLCGIAFSY